MKKILYLALMYLALSYLCPPILVSAQPLVQTPPQEAITACVNKNMSSSCNFQGAQGETLSGICTDLPGGEFACLPSSGGPQNSANTPAPTLYNESGNNSTASHETTQSQSSAMAERLSGDILLQVEANGEAWYVYPKDNERYYLGRPDDAFSIMRELGLGIAHSELTSYLSSTFPTRLSGFIMLDVEANGEAYYVYPKDKKGYYLGRPDDAFNAMRTLGLGITNADLSTISVSNSSATINSNSSGSNTSDQAGDSGNSEIGASKVVDTNQTECFNATSQISCPSQNSSFYGQDANFSGNQPSYTDNGDGTVTDNNTGLMWIQDAGSKVAYYEGTNAAASFSYAGYNDWRTPTIKELYSLMDFSGEDVNPMSSSASNPFIDNQIFVFEYGNVSSGDRIIDSQWITSNIYVSKVMNNQECFFGVNFADGRIKCYPTADNGHNNGYFMRYVRGDYYGINNFVDNGDGTITDNSTGFMWQQSDSGEGMDWEYALAYCEGLNLASYNDWRLPNAKELEYIVDYERSPDTTNSPAIDPVFHTTSITNEMDKNDYPWFWTSTTHKSEVIGDEMAVYIGFGRCTGEMNGEVMDVHGAGCQRSDPKSGNINDYPSLGNGPQGDARRVFNYVRCVR